MPMIVYTLPCRLMDRDLREQLDKLGVAYVVECLSANRSYCPACGARGPGKGGGKVGWYRCEVCWTELYTWLDDDGLVHTSTGNPADRKPRQ